MSAGCVAVRLELTELILLGRALPPAMESHLSRCQDCVREAAQVREVVATFERASGTRPVRPALSLSRRRFRRRPALLAAGAAVLLGLGLASVVLPEPDPAVRVELSRDGRMIPHPWGTEVPVVLTGLVAGQTYQLLTEDGTGHRVGAGSVHAGSGEVVRMRMVTAMHREAIVVLLVSDQLGREVAKLPVTPPSSTP